jgi:hypothetical protein
MAVSVNYDDSIFYVQTMVKTLSTGMNLDVDPVIFKEKIVEEILFVDSAINQILQRLRDNYRLIHRTEYLRMLLRGINGYVELLDACVNGKLAQSEELADFFPKLNRLLESHEEQAREIQAALQQGAVGADAPEDVVSQEEFRFLLREEEEDESFEE